MAVLANMTRVRTSTTGTGTITLGSAVTGFLSLAQSGITDGQFVSYAIEDSYTIVGSRLLAQQREVGRGVYSSTGPTLTRNVLKSTNSNNPINLSGTAEVFITALSEDINTANEFNVKHYGAVGDGSTDDTAAIQAAIDDMRAEDARFMFDGTTGGGIADGSTVGAYATPAYVLLPPGIYRVTSSLDCQSIRSIGWGIIGNGAVIKAECAGQSVLDLGGSVGGRFEGFTISGRKTLAPAVGIQLFRITGTSQVSGWHEFNGVNVVGYFTRTCMHNTGSEVNSYIKMIFENNDSTNPNGSCFMLDGLQLYHPVTSYDDTACVDGTSNPTSMQNFFGCQFRSMPDGSSPFWTSEADSLAIRNSYFIAPGAPAIIYESDGSYAPSGLDFSNCHVEYPGGSSATDSFITFKRLTSGTLTVQNLQISETYSRVATATIVAGTNVTELVLKGGTFFRSYQAGASSLTSGTVTFKGATIRSPTATTESPQLYFGTGSFGSGAWYDGATAAEKFFWGCGASGNDTFRLYSATTATNLITIGAVASAGSTFLFDGYATITGTGASTVKQITDSASVQVLQLHGDRATPATNDAAYLSGYLSNASGTQKEFARITWAAASATAGAETGRMVFGLSSSGTMGGQLVFATTSLRPGADDGMSLGFPTLGFSDLYLAAGAIIDFGNGDVTVTNGATNRLDFAGASTGYTFDAPVLGGTGAGSSLNLQSTSGTGTTDFVKVTVGTNGGTEGFRVVTGGQVLFGGTAAFTDPATPKIQTHATSQAGASTGQYMWGNNANGGLHYFVKSRSGTIGSYGIVSSGDTLGSIIWMGDDGAALRYAAQITALVDTTPGGSADMPGRLAFHTSSDGTNNVAERLRIDSGGNVIVNTAAIATNATNGFLYVPSCAGTPTGTPTSYTGRVPLVVDTTNHKLYFYDGSWRDAGP